jgi:hypothetical protein
VLEGGDGGVVRDVRDVAVEQDPDQSPEGHKANLASEDKPRIINPIFLNYAMILDMFVHLRFRS